MTGAGKQQEIWPWLPVALVSGHRPDIRGGGSYLGGGSGGELSRGAVEGKIGEGLGRG